MTAAGLETQLYAESSAVLSWLFGEQHGDIVLEILENASLIATSELTLVECDRAIFRESALGKITQARSAQLRAELDAVSQLWDIVGIGPAVISRARRPFPDDPIRALDALHVASAIDVRAVVPQLGILSLDSRIRRVAAGLGFPLLPT